MIGGAIGFGPGAVAAFFVIFGSMVVAALFFFVLAAQAMYWFCRRKQPSADRFERVLFILIGIVFGALTLTLSLVAIPFTTILVPVLVMFWWIGERRLRNGRDPDPSTTTYPPSHRR